MGRKSTSSRLRSQSPQPSEKLADVQLSPMSLLRIGHTFKQWPDLEVELAHGILCDSAILEWGNRASMQMADPTSTSCSCAVSGPLLRVRSTEGRWLRPSQPAAHGTQDLPVKAIMPKVESKMRYVDHIEGSGTEFFRLACEHDLERIVGKWKFGSYCADGAQTS